MSASPGATPLRLLLMGWRTRLRMLEAGAPLTPHRCSSSPEERDSGHSTLMTRAKVTRRLGGQAGEEWSVGVKRLRGAAFEGQPSFSCGPQCPRGCGLHRRRRDRGGAPLSIRSIR